ncbi:MAG: MtrAB system histidine kinase MtrB [Actinomycetaceae bacterium]|nr:MtrAB system histidine kinase MtrB [Actinomycetaceae bacterium]MDU0969701.1 MtrAB system histidine kinase MtrB [Actinomycetaceae bacterium]
MSQRAATLRRRVRAFGPFRIVRQSLPVRITALMLVIVTAVMTILSIFVATHVRDGVFDERLKQILTDSSQRIETVQSAFDRSSLESVDQVQDLAYQIMLEQRDASAGAGGIGVFLLRDTDSTSPNVINAVVDEDLTPVITKEMREKVESHPGEYWQSVTIPTSSGRMPGIVVGSTIQLPFVGSYDMFIVYSLATEQRSITMINQVLVVGTIGMLVIVGVLMLIMSYRALLPVRRAARAATKVAGGNLNVRLEVEGEDELAMLATAFNEMTSYLQRQITDYRQLATLQQRFVSDVSHELRTPLASIQIGADFLTANLDELPPNLRRPAALMGEQVERFSEMLADLLEISRVDARTARIEHERTDLVVLVNQVVGMYAQIAERAGVEVRVIAPEGGVEADVDRVRIERVIRNLLLNAIEFAESKPVEITVAQTPTAAAVKVRDFGVGMTDEVASHVFDRFYRADPSRKRTTGGTGLGLAISAEDAHLHGGILTVLSCPGVGSSFVMLVPRFRDRDIDEVPAAVYDQDILAARILWAKTHPGDVDTTIGMVSDSQDLGVLEEEMTVDIDDIDDRDDLTIADLADLDEDDDASELFEAAYSDAEPLGDDEDAAATGDPTIDLPVPGAPTPATKRHREAPDEEDHR